MTKQDKKRTLTEDEMDALVIADVDDESAWGERILVRSSRSRRPAWMAQAKHLDWAAKFFVVSVLHRMGVEATVTVSQSDNVDVTVVQESGRVLTVDVKTLSGDQGMDCRAVPRQGPPPTSCSFGTRRTENRARNLRPTLLRPNAFCGCLRESGFTRSLWTS